MKGWEALVTILGLMVITVVTRGFFLVSERELVLPDWVKRGLRYAPLAAIAAVVVGGTPITGGRGSLLGTLVGVALLGSIGPALTFLGINPYWERAIQGAIILLTVLLDAMSSHRKRRQLVVA